MAIIADPGFELVPATKTIRYVGPTEKMVSWDEFAQWIHDLPDDGPLCLIHEPIGLVQQATCTVTLRKGALRVETQAAQDGIWVTLDLLCGVSILDTDLELF